MDTGCSGYLFSRPTSTTETILMLPDLEYAALRFETFADEVLRPLATPVA